MKNAATRLGYVWQSSGCDSFYWQRVGRKAVRPGGNNFKYMPGGQGGWVVGWVIVCRCGWQSVAQTACCACCAPPPLCFALCPAGQGPAVPQQCPETGSGFVMGGPYWAEPIHDPAWVAGLLDQVKRDRSK